MTELLLQRFIQIRKRAEQDSISDLTYSSDHLSFCYSERTHLFQSALSAWGAVFDRELLHDDISHASQSESSCRQRIKLVRKQGVILSSAYTYFDSRHFVPTAHYKLMKKIGKLNDPMTPENFEEQRASSLKFLREYPALDELDFLPESDNEYKTFVRQKKYDSLQTFQSELLPIKKFHLARQEFRELMNLMQILASVNGTEEAYLAFRNWFVISKLLGEIKDDAEMSAEGDKGEYSKLEATIDPMLRAAVLRQLSENE